MANIYDLFPHDQYDEVHVNRADFLIAIAASKDYDSNNSSSLADEIKIANAKLEGLKQIIPDEEARA
jgi:hypothetical protein